MRKTANALFLICSLIALGCDGTYSGEGCFIGGTLVSTPSGDIPIEQVKIGDLVYGFDPVVGERVPEQVDLNEIHFADETLKIVTEGDLVFEVTDDHPLYEQAGQKWLNAGAFKVGDSLLTDGPEGKGRGVKILSISTVTKASMVPVFNLKVRNVQNAFIGGILAHSY